MYDLFFGVEEMWCFCFFFFSSRRRHTRLTCDWSSDVCSSDLRSRQWQRRDISVRLHIETVRGRPVVLNVALNQQGVRSEERRVGKSVDLGGRRIIKKKKKTNTITTNAHKKGIQIYRSY